MRNKAFTLIEMLVVVALTVIVGSLTVAAIGTSMKATTIANNAYILNTFSNSLRQNLNILQNSTNIVSPSPHILFAIIPQTKNPEVVFPLEPKKQSQKIIWDVFWLGDRFDRFANSSSSLEQNHPMIEERYNKYRYNNVQFEKTLYHAIILGNDSAGTNALIPPPFDPETIFDPNNSQKPEFATINGQKTYEEDLIPLDIFPNWYRPTNPSERQAELDLGLIWYVSQNSFGFTQNKNSIEFIIDVSSYNGIKKENTNKQRINIIIETKGV